MNFQTEVINKSQEIPVLVDFWALWCGPCQFIGPVLEELAAENNDKWTLVKVNVDENEEVSRHYGIRGIPAIKLFHKGEIIGEFSGALPRTAVQKWLDENLPDNRRDELNHILSEVNEVPDKGLIEKLQSFIGENPGYREAEILLARHLVFTDAEKAVTFVEDISMGDEHYDMSQHIRTIIKFLSMAYDGGDEIDKIMDSAKSKFLEQDLEESIRLIIEANKIDKHFLDDLPRLSAIAVFELLGRQHPLSKSYRRKFDMVLY